MAILGAQAFTAKRRAAGSWTSGVYTQGAETQYTVRGSLQPATAKELELLPEGARADTRWMLFCDAHQQLLDTGDRVVVSGADCLVLARQDWTLHGPAHRAYALGEVTSA